MTIVAFKSRLPHRLIVLTLTGGCMLLGFAGARGSLVLMNQDQASAVQQRQRLDKATQNSELKAAALTGDLSAKTAEAEAATELGLRQATCGDTLQGFYFQPGIDLKEQLNNWGIDWRTPRYNTQKWYPLFDSNNVLAGAIRSGQLVQADVVALDQAAICNQNVLNFN